MIMIYCLRVLTEYISISLCLHKVTNRKVEIKKESFMYIFIYIILLYLSMFSKWLSILTYGYWFAYTRMKLTDNFKSTLKAFGIMIITIPTMQLFLYMIFVNILKSWIKNNIFLIAIEILINIILCIVMLFWKKGYLYDLGIKVKKINIIAIFCIVSVIFVYVLFTFKNNGVLTSRLSDPIIICMIIWGLTIILLESAEMEKKHKAEELKLYEQYTHAFEDALTVIKMRQHEFDNHINAINCMQYVIENKEDLIREQQEYCKNIKNENIYNKVLLLKIPLILSGYLYSKFTIAEGKGIRVEYMIQEIKDDNRVSLNDLIEIIGILFDNAMEELESKGKTHMEVNIYYDNVDRLIVEIVNESEKILNTEIEKFFKNGYSTKGENRGMGLYRLMYLKKKYKANVLPDNFEKDGIFYFRIRVGFVKK